MKVLSSRHIVEILEKVRGPCNVNLIAQKIGSLILKEKEFLNKSILHNLKWQKKLPNFVDSIGLKGMQLFANFILIEVKDTKKENRNFIKTFKNKIIVRDLESYGLKNYFRVSKEQILK